MITYALGRELSSRRELQCPINAFIVGYVCALFITTLNSQYLQGYM